MIPFDLVVRGHRVVLPEGERPAAVGVRGGSIAAIESVDTALPAAEEIHAGDHVVLPGLVDTHVHVNDPGRAEWEGWETATRAAAAGGVTTIVDMPLNSVPATTTVAALEAKRRAAEGRARVDYGLWGGVVPGNAADLDPLVDAGVLGFKAFLVDSGVSDFPPVAGADLRAALAILAERDVPLLVHAEDPAALDPAALALDPSSYVAWLASRPPEAEARAIESVTAMAAETGAWVHIVHVSSAEGVETIGRARAGGARVTAETCPHYLFFDAGAIPDGATLFKCAPPIRDAADREGLWEALGRGALDLVASDHSPCPSALKVGDFVTAWGGIASLEVSLAATWTAARARGHGPTDIARWMSAAPARLAGIDDRKGAIAVGRDADLVVWDPGADWTVRGEDLHCRHPTTPYEGVRVSGRVLATILRGLRVFDDGRFPGKGAGREAGARRPDGSR
jgi:allantoinase